MKKIFFLCACLCACLGAALLCSSCNVTRVVTTQSSYLQHGDTTTQIVTKTIESYDATKRGL